MERIEIVKIEWKNFLSYGNQWSSYEFKIGVTLIKGHDNDKNRSNGSGKSSFLESLVFGLFGTTIKPIKKSGIVNWTNKKGCEVMVYFKRGVNEYKIHRGLKPNVFDFYINGVVQPKLAKVIDYQIMIEEDYLGMDFKTFKNLVHSNPNNSISLFDTPKGEKREFLEKLFDLGMFSEMNKLINDKLQKIQSGIIEDTNNIESNKRVINVLNSDIDGVDRQLADILIRDDSELDKLEEVAKEIITRGVYDKDVDTERKQLLEDSAELGKARALFTEVDNYITTQENDLKVANRDIEKINITDTKTSLEVKETKYNTLIAADLPTRKKKNLEEEITLKGEIKKITNYIVEIKEVIAGSRGELKAFPDPENIKGKHKCPTCYSDVDYDHIKVEIEKLKKPIEENINTNTLKEKELTTLKAGFETQITDIESKIKTIDGYIRESEQLAIDIERIKNELSTKEAELEALEKQKVIYTQSLAEKYLTRTPLTDELAKANVKYDEQQQYIRDIEKDKTLYEFNRDQLASIKESNEKAIKQKEQIQANYTKKVTERDDLQANNNKLIGGLNKNNTAKDYLSYLKNSLKDENVKQYAISSMIPFINRQTNHYLSETGHSFYVNIDGWLDAQIMGPGVHDCEYGNLSGGESKSIDLAMKFACNDVANLQSVAACDILILDEILDSSIDTQGLEQLIDIVQVKQKDNNLKVFIISHRDEVNDIVFDNEILIEKKNGFSNIKEL